MTAILVTGMGIISPIGINKLETLQSLFSQRSAIGEMVYLQTKHHNLPVGEVPCSDDDMRELLHLDQNIKITRTSLLGRVALKEAINEAQLYPSPNSAVAFVSGTTVGGMEKSEIYYPDFLHNNLRNDYIALHDCGACTDMIAQEFPELFSLVTTVSTACSSAANAIILGANLIKTHRADIAVVGGSECLSKFHLNGFNSLMILDSEPCKPFDRDRVGLNLGEGAAFLVLESAESAKKRNINPICKLSGYANTCDAFHQTASSPNGQGAYLAIKKALDNAHLKPHDIDYINAHGTGTINNDESEGAAIMRIFGHHVPPISSTKGYTGHTTSASGGIEAVISILAILHEFIPNNPNFKNQIEALSFSPVSQSLTHHPINHVLTNSFGFGGNDSSLIFSKC